MIKETQNKAATIFIVDDDDGARKGVQRLLDSYGYRTETFSSAKAFLDRSPIDAEGCLVLDHHMPEMTGMELLDELTGIDCKIPIVFLTAHGDIPTSVKAIKRGAEDFLSKLAEEKELIDAIERSLQRSRKTRDESDRKRCIQQRADSLTAREREVCSYVVAGWTNGQIGKQLGISERTVKAHRRAVMEKFEVSSLAELVRQTMVVGMQLPE
ncbi:Response regulator protein TodT [Planctomycetes bacterium CA13]|uniref:Response regulator protein TodT n=2 Tax=Novipirellula herctigrandis TaxID=2527986 RepID=A0A5C5YPA9_9BACT|nr:Response regulator protein TodT [Planctomycetes bacterium CA13]